MVAVDKREVWDVASDLMQVSVQRVRRGTVPKCTESTAVGVPCGTAELFTGSDGVQSNAVQDVSAIGADDARVKRNSRDGRSLKGCWSDQQCAAINEGFARLGPKWSRIVQESGAVLASRSAKDVRSKAQALGLLGSEAQGLGEHRRGKSGSLRRARIKSVDQAQKRVTARAENVSIPFVGTTALVNELLVTEVIEPTRAMASEAGREAFVRELNALRSVGALPLNKAVEHTSAVNIRGAQFVKLKAIFGIKNSELGQAARKHKCRLVCQGCVVKDAYGGLVEDPFEWEKPPGLVAFRATMSAAVMEHGSKADAGFFDVDNAYVHAKLRGPPTFVELGGLVQWIEGCVTKAELLKLKKMKRPVLQLPMALYGLPRSGSDFGAHARERLLSLGWKESASDKNIYMRTRGGKSEWIVLYVDDGAVFGERSAVRKAISEVKTVFTISRAATYVTEANRTKPVRFLGISLFADDERNGAWVVSSAEYARHVAADIDTGRSRKTPIAVKPEPDPDGESCGRDTRRALGRLLWLVRTTRPDLAYAVGLLARCTDRWGPEAEQGLNHVLQYLRTSAETELVFEMPETAGRRIEVVCYTDADFAVEKSTSGMCAFFRSNGTRHLVDWSSGRQRRTATSTAEAELIAVHTAVQYRAFPLSVFLDESQRSWPDVKVYVDNETALKAIAKGWSDKMIHLHKMQGVSLKWLNEIVKDGLVVFEYVKSAENLADGFTKSLSADVFEKQRIGWGIVVAAVTHGRSLGAPLQESHCTSTVQLVYILTVLCPAGNSGRVVAGCVPLAPAWAGWCSAYIKARRWQCSCVEARRSCAVTLVTRPLFWLGSALCWSKNSLKPGRDGGAVSVQMGHVRSGAPELVGGAVFERLSGAEDSPPDTCQG
ncbi:Copia protein [Porphyridium purpureum]|uniref:Copia protein n=1 Tax=Porphyridium purpureum TaxID=35688 RepID=A0A5J4Z5E3_PORPP|nr:Copia protein [Porphyridium purpureum]|eukprot:POR0595..scf295_1